MESRTRNRRYVCKTCSRSYGKAEHLIVSPTAVTHIVQRPVTWLFRDMNDHVGPHSFSRRLRLTFADTGLKPFSCDQCGQQFSRLDSLNRHSRRHTTPPTRRQDQRIEGARHTLRSALSSERERFNSFPVVDAPSMVGDGYAESASYMSTAGLHPASDTMVVPNDSSDYLNWPDSTDLLQSILSAEFVNLPSLEILPSQRVPPPESLPSETSHSSPWLHPRGQQSPWLGGENAVHHLSQIISDSVSI